MKENRKKRSIVFVSSSWNKFMCCTLFIVSAFVFLTFSALRLFYGETFHPVVVSNWQSPPMEAISSDVLAAPTMSIRETVMFPDQALIFLNYPPAARLLVKEDLECVYIVEYSDQPAWRLPPVSVDGEDPDDRVVRCRTNQSGLVVSVALKSSSHLAAGPSCRWDSVVYEALLDRDNTTVVFIKGLNLKPGRLSDASRFECVYSSDFKRPKLPLRSEVVSIAQEIARCKTPLSVLASSLRMNDTVKLSLRIKGGGQFQSIARLRKWPKSELPLQKEHEMCICTMLRNQARFLREWVMYHARIGVQRWFIYDNNSDDDVENVIELLNDQGYNVTRHLWPWIKTQESGFAHCALKARGVCNWVGFIDVDEFFHLQSGFSLGSLLRNQSRSSRVGEIRTLCHSFGPSGLKHAPPQGVIVGYTCRLAAPERHKSIVRPEALNSTLINMVHHFHLKDGFLHEDVDKELLVINHYKYQVWEVFKEKFYRRVATYVADWQKNENEGSKDRVPGLGTQAVEPADWSMKFCEVRDTGLRNQVLRNFIDPQTGLLPWENVTEQVKYDQGVNILAIGDGRKKRKHRVLL